MGTLKTRLFEVEEPVNPFHFAGRVLAWLGLAGGLALGILLALFLAAGHGAGARMARAGEKP